MPRTMPLVAALMVAVAAAGGAHAQSSSTGNPKGTVAPSTQGNAAKTPANPARTVDTGRTSDPIDESKGPPEVRRTERPGGDTSTGGLTRRNPEETRPSPAPPPGSSNSRTHKK